MIAKKNHISGIVPALLLSVLFQPLGCATASPERSRENAGTPYQTIAIKKEIPFNPGKESPRMTIDLSLLDTGGPEPFRELLWALIYDGVSPGEYGAQIIRYFEEQYAEASSVYPPGEFMNWEYAETISPETLTQAMAVVSRNREYYLGGAHGMREKKYFVIDLEENRRLRINDLPREGAEPALRGEVEEALRELTGLKSGEALSGGGFFEDTVKIPDNFFLSPGGLGFRWDPYEIAPYVMGPIEVIIPAEKARPLLSPRGLALLSSITDIK
jgi:hypothetical protein